MDWKTAYPRSRKPGLEEICAYLPPEAAQAFRAFNQQMQARFGVSGVIPTYRAACGWKYQYAHSGVVLLDDVRFGEAGFSVQGLTVCDGAGLAAALERVDALYQDGYLRRLEQNAQRRRARLAAKPRQREERGPNLNDCRWPAKVSRAQLKRLYAADAAGLPDEELADAVGLTMYARIERAREIYALMETGRVQCCHCGRVLGPGQELTCPCGQRYTYRAYRRRYRADNMPRGEASAIFDQFLLDWDRARGYAEKMRLIDGLVHECHRSARTGTVNRPVGVNLIQGAKAQVIELIEQLALG